MERSTLNQFYQEFLDSLDVVDRDVFKIYEMDFNGENYPLCEETLKKMFGTITKNGENNHEKFLAISAMFFSLLPIYGK